MHAATTARTLNDLILPFKTLPAYAQDTILLLCATQQFDVSKDGRDALSVRADGLPTRWNPRGRTHDHPFL
jgi:hypothetical protein